MNSAKRARNPKATTFSVRLDDGVNSRLERVADAAGQNKGTMAALAIAAGLGLLERIYGSTLEEAINRAAQQEVTALATQAAEDMQRAAEVQAPRSGRDKFKLELEQPRSEWTGYMAGL